MKNQVRRESRYVCVYCFDHPALCIDPYFRLYYQNLGQMDDASMDSSDVDDI